MFFLCAFCLSFIFLADTLTPALHTYVLDTDRQTQTTNCRLVRSTQQQKAVEKKLKYFLFIE